MLRQSNPQLSRVHAARFTYADFSVSNAIASRHQIHLTRFNRQIVAQAVMVLDFAADHPCEGRQTDVWMRMHMHAQSWAQLYWADMV